jgi:hypothetical protein
MLAALGINPTPGPFLGDSQNLLVGRDVYHPRRVILYHAEQPKRVMGFLYFPTGRVNDARVTVRCDACGKDTTTAIASLPHKRAWRCSHGRCRHTLAHPISTMRLFVADLSIQRRGTSEPAMLDLMALIAWLNAPAQPLVLKGAAVA